MIGNWRKNEGDGEGSSNEDASANADGDGFSTVTGRGRGRANGNGTRNGNAWGKNHGRDVDANPAGGSGGRNRAGSVSSNSGSVGQPVRSESGWTDAASWH